MIASGAARRSWAAITTSHEAADSSEIEPPAYVWPWNCDALT